MRICNLQNGEYMLVLDSGIQFSTKQAYIESPKLKNGELPYVEDMLLLLNNNFNISCLNFIGPKQIEFFTNDLMFLFGITPNRKINKISVGRTLNIKTDSNVPIILNSKANKSDSVNNLPVKIESGTVSLSIDTEFNEIMDYLNIILKEINSIKIV